MAEMAHEIVSVNLEDEMKQSYLDYAMSVIVGRALPDVRDGLKPVHRRVLFAMRELSNDWNKPYKKSARVVGDVIGKYHPHGESAVYDTIVRMAQPFSMRYMLIQGQGNFGSVDGDSPAAMRYTEVRMHKLAHQLLADLEKDTVDFIPNYDESEYEPTVMPTRIPNLLINGTTGIAVGMATNIPPHNLTEVINATLALQENPDLSVAELMVHLPGPDFPTAAIINGAAGIREAYETGRGRIYMRARTHIEEESNGRLNIIVDELPFQVNKANLLKKIADLVKDKKVESISRDNLRDESDKDGMRMVIGLKHGEVAEVTLNQLYSMTQLQCVFGINMVGLIDNRPKLLNLREILSAFLRHRRDVVTRRTLFELSKARDRAHILEGLAVALANVDEVIALIKAAPNPAEARIRLQQQRWDPGLVKALLGAEGASMSRPESLSEEIGMHKDGYQLSAIQAQAILDLRLQKLTSLEQDKLTDEYREILDNIRELLRILGDPDVMQQLIRDELLEVREQFGDERRTEILEHQLNLSMEDLIAEEDVVVTLSHGGYAKTQNLDRYQSQKRGGRGRSATKMKDADFIERLWVTNTHDTLLCFSSTGKVYWIKVYDLPQASHASRGKPFVNLLPLGEGERINAVLPVREFLDDQYVFFSTAAGTVKKTPLAAFSRPRANGIWAIDLVEGDTLINVALTDGNKDILLFASNGKCVRFNETDARSMGRVSRGVRGIRLLPEVHVVSMQVAEPGQDLLMATENGYGKRTSLEEFPVHRRGGQGVIAIQASERNGALVAALSVSEEDDVMLINDNATLVRTPAVEISRLGRNTQGVTLIRLGKKETLVGLARVLAIGDDESEEEEG